jgi:nucleoid-associated protein YgaU
MALKSLTIVVEKPGKPPMETDTQGNKVESPQFEGESSPRNLKAMFNPTGLSVSRSVQWQSQDVAKRDNPEMHHTGAPPTTLNLVLFFDTYDSPSKNKESVRIHTDKLLGLAMVDGDKHRPPICRLTWGSDHAFFQGVVEQLQLQFTLFMGDGKPVRATATCTFKSWKQNIKDLKDQNLMSSDVAKVWLVKHGQTLATIATQEYGDPRMWRPIAQANRIDDPLKLRAGELLILPALKNS